MNLLQLKLKSLKNSLLKETEYSSLKMFTVLIFTLSLLIGEFYLFTYIFSFLGGIQGIGMVIIEKLFYLYFMALFFLLVFSNVIVSYSNVYNSEETLKLVSYPLRYLKIFDVKFMESTVLSSWAFFFITLPFIGAFTAYNDLSWKFLSVSILYLFPYIIIAAIVGNFISLILARLFNKKWFKVFLILIAVVAIFTLIVKSKGKFGTLPSQNRGSIVFMLNDLIPQFKFSQFPLLPSYWLSYSLLSFSWREYNNSLFYFFFSISNCLMGLIILRYVARKTYYNTWEKLRSLTTPSTAKKHFNVIKFVDMVLNRIFPKKSAFINKDIKLFFRDPVQWSQGLMFFGLLAIYFGNLENLSYNLVAGYWKNGIVFLNMMATSLTLASLCVRFIFPQFSLEGNKAWFLKTAPVSFKRILLEKFWGFFVVALIITETLITLSNYMLEVNIVIFYFSSTITAMICFALVGLSCGLGAIFPNFKKNDPTAIVSGIGGSLNFILSMIYLGIVVWILAPVIYQYVVTQNLILSDLNFELTISTLVILLLSLITGILPMYLGIRKLKRMEF